MFARLASSAIDSWACFFVPTKRIWPPSEERSRTNAYASSTRTRVCWRSMMWIPLRSMKMKRFIFGFHRRAWCPKWTPDSKSCFIVTTATAFSLDASASRPRRALAGRRRDLVKRAKYRARLTRSAINCNKNGQRAPAGARGRKKPGRRCPGSFRTPKALGEVVADVAEDVLELTTEEDHGDDDGNGDNSNDESVLN